VNVAMVIMINYVIDVTVLFEVSDYSQLSDFNPTQKLIHFQFCMD